MTEKEIVEVNPVFLPIICGIMHSESDEALVLAAHFGATLIEIGNEGYSTQYPLNLRRDLPNKDFSDHGAVQSPLRVTMSSRQAKRFASISTFAIPDEPPSASRGFEVSLREIAVQHECATHELSVCEDLEFGIDIYGGESLIFSHNKPPRIARW
jgi:hypothetical protein